MTVLTVTPARDAGQITRLLDTPEIARLVAELDATRWTGRPGYPIRTMVGMFLVKSLYTLPTWTRTVALVTDHAALRAALDCETHGVPSNYACYRFTAKLRAFHDLLAECIDRVLTELHDAIPTMGETIAIDGSDLPAYANGQRYVSKGGRLRERFSDPDASWGHRSSISTRSGGGYYGYKVHAAVCTTTGLPVAWEVRTAKDAETPLVPTLLDAVTRRGITPAVCVMDKGYDNRIVVDACTERGIRPVTPLRMTPAVKAGKDAPPSCEHGTWTFAGADAKRGATKWRCPTGDCTPASTWVKADRLHPLIPRHTARHKALYRQRAAVEREFGTLKHQWALLPLRVRGIDRVRLHADFSILTRLASRLDKERGHGRIAA